MIAPHRATLDGLLAQALDGNGGGDAAEVFFACFADPSERWNGFACPYFSREQIEEMCPALVIEGVLLLWRWGDDGSLVTVCPENPDEIDEWPATRIEAHPEPVWPFGSCGWTWLLEADMDRFSAIEPEAVEAQDVPHDSTILNYDGGDCSLAEFLERNRDTLSSDEVIAACRLNVGDVLTIPVHFGFSQIVRIR